MSIVELWNVHYPTDNVRPEGLSELQVVMGVVRHYFSVMESFRESVIREKCSRMAALDDGFLGSMLNTLEQVDLEKLEAEVQEFLKSQQRIDYLTASKDKWFKIRYADGMGVALEEGIKLRVLFPNGDVAEGRLQRKALLRDGEPIIALGVLVDNGDHIAWYDLIDVKVDRDSIPALSQ